MNVIDRPKCSSWSLLGVVALSLMCGCSSREVENQTEAVNPDTQSPLFPGVVARGCDWALIYDPDQPGGNSAFPDRGARYWVAVVSGELPAGTRLRMEGEYPNARYSSLQIYDGRLRGLDSLSDFQIEPNSSSSNPFIDQTRENSGIDYGGSYTAYVRINQEAPADRESNTMYRPPTPAETQVTQRTALAYRTYLPRGGNQGMVGLPRLRLETADGDLPLDNDADAATCAQIAASLRKDGARLSGSANLLDPTPASPLPTFQRFDGAAGTGAGGQGLGFNRDNGFMYAKTQKAYAPILIVRARAPSYTTQDGAGDPPQVRYWSICEAGFNTQMVYTCTADRDTTLDGQGYFTVVLTDDESRPSVLDSAPGYAWLRRGPEALAVVTMRELLAHPSFEQATVNVDLTHPAPQQKGEFQPLATYCSEAAFNAAVAMGPAAAFAACDASRRLLP